MYLSSLNILAPGYPMNDSTNYWQQEPPLKLVMISLVHCSMYVFAKTRLLRSVLKRVYVLLFFASVLRSKIIITVVPFNPEIIGDKKDKKQFTGLKERRERKERMRRKECLRRRQIGNKPPKSEVQTTVFSECFILFPSNTATIYTSMK